MALATQCPHCHTTFRVAHDQLKLRAGLVRCGACKQIFNGIENLLRLDQPAAAPATTPPLPRPEPESTDTQVPPGDTAIEQPAATTAGTDKDNPAEGHGVDFYLPPDEDADVQDQGEQASETSAILPEEAGADTAEQSEDVVPPAPEDPLLRMTLMDFSDRDYTEAMPPPEENGRPDPLDRAMEDLQRKPLRGSKPTDAVEEPETADEAYDEPSFVRQGRRRRRMGRALRMTMAAGSILLLLVLLAQAAYVFRDQLAARFPETKPVLLEVCAYLDCQVGLPAQIDAVSIESSELQTLAPNSDTLALTVLLRNHDAVAQTWPHLELTLNDAAERPLARRVFAPSEYLPQDLNPRLGFAARSEQPVRLFFELDEIKASGYRVYLFYP